MNWKSQDLGVLLLCLCLTLISPQPVLASGSVYIGGGVGAAEFDEVVFEGDGNSLLLDLGVRFSSGSEPNERASLEFGLMFDALFNADASRGDDDDLDLFVKTLYLRYDHQLGDKVWGFGQLGYSSIDVEGDDTSCTLIPLSCDATTNYRNDDEGISWGVGVNIQTGLEHLVSIGYFDYSQSDIDYSTWRLTLRREINW